LIDNLSGRQLLSKAFAVLENSKRIGIEEDEDEKEEPEGSNTTSSRFEKKRQCIRKWTKDDITQKNVLFPKPDFSEYRNLSPVQLFELLLMMKLLNFL